MNMNQLKYVLTVANSSSLREAAMKLYISQPALSLSISELENELGIVLFDQFNKYLRYERAAAMSFIIFLICSVSAGVYIYTNLREKAWEK